jgi:DNA replication and repair protein RecF
MILKSLVLQHFRSYAQAVYRFTPDTTVIIGPNAAGKSNLIEAIYLLTTGKSARTEKEKQLVEFGEAVAWVKGIIGLPDEEEEEETLEVVLSQGQTSFLQKKYMVNGVSKRRADFAGRMVAVLFTPSDLDVVIGQPGTRRRFLDDVLEQVDLDYRHALTTYTKAIRQRNALLEQVQETGFRNEKLFAYWDELTISTGQIVSGKRAALIEYINNRDKELFPFTMIYDSSVISQERLLQYKDAEVGAGVTLVGPHRDDIIIQSMHDISKELEDVKYFASRGQQRLVILELKMAQIAFIQEKAQTHPILLLDDIFSELDTSHINSVLERVPNNQTIITTTHKEFLSALPLKRGNVIELGGE